MKMGDVEMEQFNYYFSLKRHLDIQYQYQHNTKDVLFEVQEEQPQNLNASQQDLLYRQNAQSLFEKRPSKKKSKIVQTECKDV